MWDEDLKRAATMPVGMLGTALAKDVADDHVIVSRFDRIPTATAPVELLGDCPDQGYLIAPVVHSDQAAAPVGQAFEVIGAHLQAFRKGNGPLPRNQRRDFCTPSV